MEIATKRKAVVIGAGVAGLTAAIALAQRDWSVQIVERDPDGRTAGWGLALTGPSLRALRSLGIDEQIVAAGYGMTRITNWQPNGEAVEIDPPRVLGPDAPAMVGIARPALQNTLTERAERLGVTLTYDTTVADVDQQGDEVTIHLANGSEMRANLVIGADGIRSQTRRMIGLDAPLRHTGQAVWRARLRRPEWATGVNTFSLLDRQVGVVPIGAEEAYIFYTENNAPRQVIEDEFLADRLQDELEPFTGLAAELREAVRDSDGVVRRFAQTVIVEKPWNVGRVVLVGDASHALSPQIASGAGLAIEDAAVLAEELDRTTSVDDALSAFAARRVQRCATLVKASERVAELEQSQRHRESHALIDECHGLMAQPA